MNTIRFSHDYPKLHRQRRAQLIAVLPLNIPEDMTDELLKYDTATEEGGHYILSNGRYIQLILVGDKRIPFCTIRKERPAFGGMVKKSEFYANRIGQEFNIVIKTQGGEG